MNISPISCTKYVFFWSYNNLFKCNSYHLILFFFLTNRELFNRSAVIYKYSYNIQLLQQLIVQTHNQLTIRETWLPIQFSYWLSLPISLAMQSHSTQVRCKTFVLLTSTLKVHISFIAHSSLWYKFRPNNLLPWLFQLLNRHVGVSIK